MVDVSLSMLGGAGWQFLDNNGKILAGGRLYTYQAGTTTPLDTYTDNTGNTSNGVYVQLDSAGRPSSEVWLNIAYNYKFEVRTAAGVTIRTYDNIIPVPNFTSLSATTGAGLVGFSQAVTYPSNTVGERLRKFGDLTLGQLASGTTVSVSIAKTFSGANDGTSDYRNWVDRIVLTGANSVDQVVGRTMQLELTHTSGTVTRAFNQQSYGRLGLSGSTTGNVTSWRGYDMHFANEGSGTVVNAACYVADGVDLLDGTGPITKMHGFSCADQGHATRVTSEAFGFFCNNMTGGAATTGGFVSDLSGSNKFAFLSRGDSPSAFAGNVAIGTVGGATDRLETYQGYAKLCGSTTKLATGSYHEIRSGATTHTLVVSNSNASTPYGIRIQFDGANPNNTTQTFITCDGQGVNKFIVWTNGNVVNANNSYGAISDRRFKTDIKNARSQIDDIRKLRFRNYRLKSDPDREQLGLVAQEAMKVSPGLVSEGGKGAGRHYQVNYSLLYLKAAKALQEAIALIDDLQARVGKLERNAA